MIFSPSTVPLGELQTVNSYDGGPGEEDRHMTDPVVAAIANGGFVIAWTSEGQDGDGKGIFARRFDENGDAIGEEFRVNTFTLFDQQTPAITSLPDGGFTIVWESDRQDGYEGGIYGQRYDADGNRTGGEVQVSQAPQTDQSSPDIISFADGSTMVAWRSQTASNSEIFGRGFAADGTPITAEYRLNSSDQDFQGGVSLAALGPASFAASWSHYVSSALEVDTITRVFSDLTGSAGDEIWVGARDTWRNGDQQSHLTTTILDGDGTYYVFWSSAHQRVGSTEYRHVDAAGNLLGEETFLARAASVDGVTAGADGIQTIYAYYVWGRGPTTYLDVLSYRILSDAESQISQEPLSFEGPLRLNWEYGTYPDSSDRAPSVAQLNSGTVIVAWNNFGDSASDILFQQVALNSFPTGSVTIHGSRFVGETLTAFPVAIDDPNGVGTVRYHWFRGGSEIAGATGLNYVISAADVGEDISFELRFEDGIGARETIRSENQIVNIGVAHEGADTAEALVGSEGDDQLTGLGGNDTLSGIAGDDLLDGGNGDDQISGGGTIVGGMGHDVITLSHGIAEGGDGNDTITSSSDSPKLILGGFGNDLLGGSAGADTLSGNSGNDTIYAGEEGDSIVGGSGQDVLFGEAGNDTIDPGTGVDTISSGEGFDIIQSSAAGLDRTLIQDFHSDDIIHIANESFVGTPSFRFDGFETTLSIQFAEVGTSGITIRFAGDLTEATPDVLQQSEHIEIYYAIFRGTDGNDTLPGNTHGNFIEGLEGHDSLMGLEGEDTLDGGLNADTLRGGEGDDLLLGQHGFDTLFGDTGDDTLRGHSENDSLLGGAGNDLLEGGAAFAGVITGDTLRGGDGMDTLYGASRDDPEQDDGTRDMLYGDAGDDLLIGASGDDYLYGGNDDDTLFGSAGEDRLFGDIGNDSLDGGVGADRLLGENGDDTLDGGAGRDTLDGGFRHDLLQDLAGISVMYGGPGRDTLISGSDDDTLFGEEGEDSLAGGYGNDALDGGAQHDTLDGGDGSDRLVGGDGNDVLIGGTSETDIRDLIYAGSGDDYADGGYGNDEIRGDAGNDTLAGGFGGDTLIGGLDNDQLSGGAYGDLLFGSDGDDLLNGGWGHDQLNGGSGADRFMHLGVFDHGSDWVQDYMASEEDTLLFGDNAALATQLQVNYASTPDAGESAVEEAFVIYRPSGQILWALVDGADQSSIYVRIDGENYDLLG
ncbi:hypothetical protein CSC82_20455 [Rhodobacteraceae bacterium 4F10]|nr:hypothetical protein CSC82_20455 [Rhodobacteraceae bacterium 4F10]